MTLPALGMNFSTPLRELEVDDQKIKEDIDLILEESKLPLSIHFNWKENTEANTGKILCSGNSIDIQVEASSSEWTSTLYYGIQKLGFLFPHPRVQISPKLGHVLSQCGKTFKWRPAYKYRGFHLHTMHPNEWVHGFLMGKEKIAHDTIRWHLRNGQNVLNLTLLKMKDKEIFESLKSPFALARSLGIHTGIMFGVAQNQQNSYKLLSLLQAFLGGDKNDERIQTRLSTLLDNIDVSFMGLTAGMNEFMSVDYEKTLKWLEEAAEVSSSRGIQLFTSIHVSTNQHKEPWGNYNFLPQFSSSKVGAWPHTVMFYGLYDEKVPMYGNENFSHMLSFLKQEKSKRPVWYFPETSYWIAMDVDAPLLLTDYLTTRALDMKNLHQENLEGHINFTTGNELGYWLFDWSLTLYNNLDYKFDPLIGLKLLGEDTDSWKSIVDFQTEFFKNKQLISILSFPSLQDDLTSKHRIHERNTLKDLKKKPELLEQEISALEEVLPFIPSTSSIKHPELKSLMEVTFLRIHHALNVRKALQNRKNDLKKSYLKKAREYRMLAQERVNEVMETHNRYPEAGVFKRHKNPTAYSWGYGYPASKLHFWVTEEKRVQYNLYNPFYRNLYEFLDIIL